MAISATDVERHTRTVRPRRHAFVQPALSRLTALLAGVMLAQSASGLLLPTAYRDVEWIAATWWGNDWITLGLALPLLGFAFERAARGSARGLLLLIGLFAYGAYNYAYYLFGAALNAFFPFYLGGVLLSAIGLITLLSRIDPPTMAAHFRAVTPVRIIGGYFAFVGVVLTAVWLLIWAAHVFMHRPAPIEPEAFKLVAALDIVLMAPVLTIGGGLLWRRRAWGHILTCVAGVQASLYLTVLLANSIVFIRRGLAAWPDEMPLWGALALTTASMTAWLFANAAGTGDT